MAFDEDDELDEKDMLLGCWHAAIHLEDLAFMIPALYTLGVWGSVFLN